MLKDAGKTIKVFPMMDGPMEPEEKTVYQELCFKESMLPEIADWKVGEIYKLVIEVKMKGQEIEEEDGKEYQEGEFDVLSVGAYEEPMSVKGKKVLDKLGMR